MKSASGLRAKAVCAVLVVLGTASGGCHEAGSRARAEEGRREVGQVTLSAAARKRLGIEVAQVARGTLPVVDLAYGTVDEGGVVNVGVPPHTPPVHAYEVEAGDRWVDAALERRGHGVGDDGMRHDRLVVKGPEAPSLLPGSMVSVHLERAPAGGAVVPAEAVAPGGSGDGLWVEKKPGTYRWTTVEVAGRFGDRVRVSSGVRVGERVVVRGAMALSARLLREVERGSG